MAKGGEEITLGTDAWNVAQGYTAIKILRPLIFMDRWDTIAQFGTEEIDEDVVYNTNQINKRRVEALERFVSTLKQLLGNVKFALKKADHEKVANHLLRVKTLEEFVPKSYALKSDPVDHEDQFIIDEDLFKYILTILEDIKDDINVCLNNAGLIFRTSEEMDIDKIMNDIVEGG